MRCCSTSASGWRATSCGAADARPRRAAAEQRFQELVRTPPGRGRQQATGQPPAEHAVASLHVDAASSYEFYGEIFDVSTWGIFALSFVVGIVGGIYGIGGGAIIAPFFVAFFGLPVYTVAGAALMGTFITSVAGVSFYQAIAPLYPELAVAPDWPLGLLFGLGGAAGMYCGARLQKHVPARRSSGCWWRSSCSWQRATCGASRG